MAKNVVLKDADSNELVLPYATKEYVDTSVANLVNSAPEALNTLGELATALQNHEDEYDALLETVGSKAEGPKSSTNNAIARFDGTDGKKIQNSTDATLDDTGNLSVRTLNINLTNAARHISFARNGWNFVSATGGSSSTIGFLVGDSLSIAAANASFAIANSAIFPGNKTTGTVDIGREAYAFKNLYMHGAIKNKASGTELTYELPSKSGTLALVSDLDNKADLNETMNAITELNNRVDGVSKLYNHQITINDGTNKIYMGILSKVSTPITSNSTFDTVVSSIYPGSGDERYRCLVGTYYVNNTVVGSAHLGVKGTYDHCFICFDVAKNTKVDIWTEDHDEYFSDVVIAL